MQAHIPLTRDLVLIGGGHAHALVLRKWGMRPLPGVRLTLINPGATAPYTGMLPGHIAGHYPLDALEIDLMRLAEFAGARLIDGPAVALDPKAQHITVEGHGEVAYDVASLDIGVTTDLPDLPGFDRHGIGAKPMGRYAARWRSFLQGARDSGTAQPVSVIGGGVAGVELALAMSHALHQAVGRADITLIEAQDQLTGTSEATRARLTQILKDHGVTLWSGADICEVTAAGPRLRTGEVIPAALVIGATGATPQPWLQDCDLPLKDGFVRVGPSLQVNGYQTLFAAGDCAHMDHAPRPKAGVFAVRAAPILHDNLRATLMGHDMRPYQPQKTYLKLISLGEKSALAEKWQRPWSGPLLWRWKDHIDRAFMRKLTDLPAMDPPGAPAVAAQGVAEEFQDGKPLCAGCGSKVGPGALAEALQDLPQLHRPDVLTGSGDDAAVLRLGDVTQVISTDHLRGFDADPARVARIAAVHALGDIWAMGAKPQVALAQIVLPRMSEDLQRRSLRDIMRHAGAVFAEAGAQITGGHTTQGSELTIGFTVTGTCDRPITHEGAQPGDALILTRPLGSGTLLAARMQGKARGRDVLAMLRQMAESQGQAAEILHVAHAMTDVTGFGLAGHLQALCRASGTGAEIRLADLPLYDGAEEMAEAGVTSTLFGANLAHAPVIDARGARGLLLHDPQTAGGLLAAVAPEQTQALLHALQQAGVPAVEIGRMTDQSGEIRCC